MTARVNGVEAGKRKYSKTGRYTFGTAVPPKALQRRPAQVEFEIDQSVKHPDKGGREIGVIAVSVSPELAVEVISPSESAADVDRKVELLLAHGSQTVWVIYPRTSKVQVYLANRTSFSRGIHDSLSLPDLLPGWELPVAGLFEK